MEQNIYDILVNGLDLNAFYSFIDSKTELNHNTPELVFQHTTWSALVTIQRFPHSCCPCLE